MPLQVGILKKVFPQTDKLMELLLQANLPDSGMYISITHFG